MSTIIYVSLTAEDTFKLVDQYTGKVVIIKSADIHDPCYITLSSIKGHFLSKFEDYDDAVFYIPEDALTRINSIMDFNAIDDRW